MKSGTRRHRATWKKRLLGLPPRTARMVEALATAIGRQDMTRAQAVLPAVLALAPRHPEVLRLHGLLQHVSGDHAGAADLFRQALAQQPGDALVLNNLGSALRAAGEVDAALVAYREATECAPDLAAAWYNLGRLLKAQARLQPAQESLQRALALEPEHADANIVLGDVYKATGDISGAAAAYRRVLQSNPGHAQAWFGLANLKTVPLRPDELAQLSRQFADPERTAEDSILIGFALAKALEDAGEMGKAFAVLEKVNACKRRQTPWNAAAFSHWVDAIRSAFATPTSAQARSGQGAEIVFVVSLPRAGSTLVEQILAAHEQVQGAGELPDLQQVLQAESRRRGVQFPAWVGEAGAADWQRLGEEYLQRTRRWRGESRRSTDKCLDNWPLVGAAMAMLPGAHVVVCRRDPLETCLACYRQLFASGQAFSYALDDLATYWHDFDRLCRHWLARYPEQVCELVHEDLLADPEGRIRGLLDACGLPFAPACLEPHRHAGDVRTASAAQVRQPLRRDTARAAGYGAALDGLRRALQDAGAELARPA